MSEQSVKMSELTETTPFSLSIIEGDSFLISGLVMAANYAVDFCKCSHLASAALALETLEDSIHAHYDDTNWRHKIVISTELLDLIRKHENQLLEANTKAGYHLSGRRNDFRIMIENAKLLD